MDSELDPRVALDSFPFIFIKDYTICVLFSVLSTSYGSAILLCLLCNFVTFLFYKNLN